jgi:hypothetical protein
MVFLVINLTKDSRVFLLHGIHSPFSWRILKKIIFFFGLKNPSKKNKQNKKTGEKHFVEQKMRG